MDNSYIKNNLEQIFESFKEMIKVETVVGQAVHIGDAILVPFVDVTFGFGSGGVTARPKTGAAVPAAAAVPRWNQLPSWSSKGTG